MGSDDMTETDDSDYDDPMDRANRLYVDNYNYDLSEGMTPMTYTPPLRRNRRRRYEVRKTKEADIVESVSVTGDRDFQADMGSPESEPMAQPRTVVDGNFQDVSDNIDDRGGWPRTGNDQNIYSDEDSFFFDRPVAGSPTVGDWLDGPSIIDGINVGRMVIEEMREMASDEANFSADNDSGPVKRIARELRRAWAENNAKPVEERESCQVPGVILVYVMMNGNFKGGLNNAMPKNKGSVDGRHDQWCVDNRHWPETRASLCDNPIRVKGRFGCPDSPVRDADWSDGHSVSVSPVGDIRIEYIGDAFSQGQSTDATPLTELIDFYTFLQTYSDCATGFTSIWTGFTSIIDSDTEVAGLTPALWKDSTGDDPRDVAGETRDK